MLRSSINSRGLGYSNILIYTKLCPFFTSSNIFFIFFFQKNDIFWHEGFVEIYLGSSKKRTVLVGHFYAYYGLFLRSIYRMGKFGGLLKYQIFWGACIVVLFFFWGGG